MKVECDSRELATGAPVNVGTDSALGNTRDEGKERIEAGVKAENQTSAVRSGFGATQGNGTRGFTVAELTKMDTGTDVTGGAIETMRSQDKGESMGVKDQIRVPGIQKEGFDGSMMSQDFTLGSLHVPGVKGENQDKGEAVGVKDHIRVPSIQKEGFDGSLTPGMKGMSQDFTFGSLHVPGVKGQSQDKGEAVGVKEDHIRVPGIQKEGWGGSLTPGMKGISQDFTFGSLPGVKGENHSSDTTKAENHSVIPAVRSGVTSSMDARRKTQNSGAEIPSMAATKRTNRDGSTLETSIEAVIKRLKREGGAGNQGQNKTNIADLLNLPTIRRGSQEDAGVPSVTARQGSEMETERLPRENHTSNPEMENSAISNAGSLNVKMDDQDTSSAMVDTDNAKISNQDCETKDMSVEAIETGKLSQGDPALKDCSGDTVNSTQEKDRMDKESMKITFAEAESHVGSIESPAPAIKKFSGTDKENESEGQSKDEPQKAVSQQTAEEGTEDVKKPDDEKVSCSIDGNERKVVACGGVPGVPKTKPEMVSTETQCDDNSMSPSGDEYSLLGEDAGVPGECLGGCEPGNKPHMCNLCDTSFRTPYELSRHCRVHTGERPYQCRLCHRCFKRKDHVEVHTRRHLEDRRYVCTDCGATFVTSSCLLRHQRRAHQALFTKRLGEEENGEGEMEGEAGDGKGDGKDLLASKDAQKNGRRNKKNKPDTTYRPGGKTVCIIKKRNLRQRSYSFVELEDDVECFESDEEDRIPFLKVQEQRREEIQEESGSQSSQLDHSLFPASIFNPEAPLSHLLLLGEMSRLLSHSLLPSAPDTPAIPPAMTPSQPDKTCPPPPQDSQWDSDDSDFEPPLVACDVTFMEGEGEVAGISLPDDGPVGVQGDQGKTGSMSGPLQPVKTGPNQTTLRGGPGTKDLQGCTNSTPARNGTPTQPGSTLPCTPPTSGRPAPPPGTNNKVGGTVVGPMGVPRTAWVMPANNTKGKNTCDACRRRNEANRLAQAEKERQALAAQATVKQEQENKPKDTPEICQTVDTKTTPKPASPPPPPPPVPTPPPPPPPPTPPSSKPPETKPAVSKRGRKTSSSKKQRSGKASAAVKEAAAALPQRPHKCPLCPFTFRSATDLKRHASTHSGERPFLCELCGAGFMRKCHLQLHVRRHSGERRHACQECRMRFFTPSDLARHQAIHQAEEKALECHLCHLTFRRAFHLERHIRRHNEAAPFACKLCGAFFSSAAALKSHDKHHRTPGPHACPDCTAAFTTATALSRHRRVHSARHHRLLRAIERHATAKSSYECVSSEGSPLSLVIRKVAASGEGGTGAKNTCNQTSNLPDKEKEKKEDKDKITSAPGMEVDQKADSNVSVTNNGTNGKVEEGEDMTPVPPAADKTKENRGSITTSPSIAKQVKGSRKSTRKRGSVTSALDSITNQAKQASQKAPSRSSNRKKNTTAPTFLPVNKEADIREDVNRSKLEKTTTVQNTSLFGLLSLNNEQDEIGALNLTAPTTRKGDHTFSNHKGSVFSSINSDKDSDFKSTFRKAGNSEPANVNNRATAQMETRGDPIEEVNGKCLDLSPVSKERKEAQGSTSYNLFLPSRDIDAVEDVYKFHSESGYPSEEEEVEGGVREEVTTTS